MPVDPNRFSRRQFLCLLTAAPAAAAFGLAVRGSDYRASLEFEHPSGHYRAVMTSPDGETRTIAEWKYFSQVPNGFCRTRLAWDCVDGMNAEPYHIRRRTFEAARPRVDLRDRQQPDTSTFKSLSGRGDDWRL